MIGFEHHSHQQLEKEDYTLFEKDEQQHQKY